MSSVSAYFGQHGGSYLIGDDNYSRFVSGHNDIGRPDGQFMIPSNQMDELLTNYSNDPREWERQLGLWEGSLGNEDIRRVDVYNPHDYEPRLPTSDLSGSNEKFIPGGKTPGGQDECVINQFPNPENNPTVGKITTLDNSLSDARNTNYISATPSNVASIGGGGARAPDDQIAGTKPVEPPPPQNGPPEIAGQKPSQPQATPDHTEPQIAGTTPDKKQDFDINAAKATDATAVNNLSGEANKAISNGVTDSTGIA